MKVLSNTGRSMGYMTGEGVWSVELVFALAGQLLLEQFPDVAYMSSASADKLPLHAGQGQQSASQICDRRRKLFAPGRASPANIREHRCPQGAAPAREPPRRCVVFVVGGCTYEEAPGDFGSLLVLAVLWCLPDLACLA